MSADNAGLALPLDTYASPRDMAAAFGLGLLSAASFPPLSLWPAAIVSICCLLRLLRDGSPEKTRLLGIIYGLTYGMGTMYWMFNLFSMMALSLIALFGAYFWLLTLLIGLTRGHTPLARAALVGIFAVGIDWLRGDCWYLRFPWYTMPHALAQSPPWIAGARWVGTYGLTFLAWFIAGWGAFGRPMAWSAFALFPACWLLLPALPEPDHTALIVQAETARQGGGSKSVDAILPTISESTADLVAMPEYAYADDLKNELRSHPEPAGLARKFGCPVVFGAMNGSFGQPGMENIAAVLGSDGKLVGTFAKVRPVPLFLDGKAGTGRDVFPVEQGTLGVGICFDFDAPEIAADLARNGATVFIVPTFDAMSWSRNQHVHHELLLRLRAVENDRWIVRPASSGRSEVVSPHGVPSEESVEVGESGYVSARYGHRTALAIGGQTFFLGPVAAICTGIYCVVLLWSRWRRRNTANPLPRTSVT